MGPNAEPPIYEPRRRFMRDLADLNNGFSALVDGPHGVSINVGKYQVVLMVVSGCGIAAQLPYLHQLLYDYNRRRVRARRIRLIWVKDTPGSHSSCCHGGPMLTSAEPPGKIEALLNEALTIDELNNGQILQVPIFVEQLDKVFELSSRANIMVGLPDWDSVVRKESDGGLIRRVQEEENDRGELIVTDVDGGTAFYSTQLAGPFSGLECTSAILFQEAIDSGYF
ncbi:cell surface metalloreductase [Fusarium beomiforme]|uniref:Cell surface metalloreductase n=1 Tax=Fusarium beomiforme TaxID=44412 RepID=A0A9P5A3D5_9HYPO|nr:cell surface metalloreductase [Fusarium beomiforme]